MVERVQRQHTKGQIDRAGKTLLPWWKGEENSPKELIEYYEVIQNWRSSHALPLLTFRIVLSRRARRVNGLVAQRLKRFPSIMNKLAREPHMKLSQMQDLGGCRAIVPNMDAVRRLHEFYVETPPLELFPNMKRMECNDYISTPKPDGYRGIHLIGRYRARSSKNEPWNGQRIEIQLRSQLQHAFATAVETVTTFTREPLKFGAGPQEWRRFFSLMGSVFAIREETPLVPDTPFAESDIKMELRQITKELNVHTRLRNWTNAVATLPERHIGKYKWLLLVLNLDTSEVRVMSFKEKRQASKELARIEKDNEHVDAVMVWVKSVHDLRQAYPNYYADTKEFVDALNVALQNP